MEQLQRSSAVSQNIQKLRGSCVNVVSRFPTRYFYYEVPMRGFPRQNIFMHMREDKCIYLLACLWLCLCVMVYAYVSICVCMCVRVCVCARQCVRVFKAAWLQNLYQNLQWGRQNTSWHFERSQFKYHHFVLHTIGVDKITISHYLERIRNHKRKFPD